MLKEMKVRTQIGMGFGLLTILIAVIVAFVFAAMIKSSDGFDQYRELARDTNLAGRLQEELTRGDLLHCLSVTEAPNCKAAYYPHSHER